MKKKFYKLESFSLDSGAITVDMKNLIELIETEVNNSDDQEQMEFRITPIWMTQQEYENLGEYQF